MFTAVTMIVISAHYAYSQPEPTPTPEEYWVPVPVEINIECDPDSGQTIWQGQSLNITITASDFDHWYDDRVDYHRADQISSIKVNGSAISIEQVPNTEGSYAGTYPFTDSQTIGQKTLTITADDVATIPPGQRGDRNDSPKTIQYTINVIGEPPTSTPTPTCIVIVIPYPTKTATPDLAVDVYSTCWPTNFPTYSPTITPTPTPTSPVPTCEGYCCTYVTATPEPTMTPDCDNFTPQCCIYDDLEHPQSSWPTPPCNEYNPYDFISYNYDFDYHYFGWAKTEYYLKFVDVRRGTLCGGAISTDTSWSTGWTSTGSTTWDINWSDHIGNSFASGLEFHTSTTFGYSVAFTDVACAIPSLYAYELVAVTSWEKSVQERRSGSDPPEPWSSPVTESGPPTEHFLGGNISSMEGSFPNSGWFLVGTKKQCNYRESIPFLVENEAAPIVIFMRPSPTA